MICVVGKGKYLVFKTWGKLLDIGFDVIVIFGDLEDYYCDLVVRLGVYGVLGDRVLI